MERNPIHKVRPTLSGAVRSGLAGVGLRMHSIRTPLKGTLGHDNETSGYIKIGARSKTGGAAIYGGVSRRAVESPSC